MAYKDIIVHMGGVSIDERARVAVKLAEDHGAHLVGLHVTQPPDVPAYVEAQLTGEMLKAQERYARQDRDNAQAAFDKAIKGASVGTEWRAVQGDAIEALKLHGRHADLAVIGQTNPETTAAINLGIAGRVALSLGRPVLAIPYEGKFETVGQNILVAWDGSRAAARALGDAIPLLRMARAVNVLSLSSNENRSAMVGVDIATHLARHDIRVEVRHLQTDDTKVGEKLLSSAADFESDMLVMGAYGHARWRELVFGGVTEYMLEHMTLPVLMSH